MSGLAHNEGMRAPVGEPDRGRIGMWLFVSTEALLFGGLFLLYSVYRYKHQADFHLASAELSRLAGTVNTLVLITSSLSAALSIHFLREGQARGSRACLAATILLGMIFLVVKGFEWGAKFEHGLYPSSPALLTRPPGEVLYFGLYFAMTGLHAVHVMAGMGVFSFALARMRPGASVRAAGPTRERPIFLENAGLFWHLVDVIWIFLFPLFYLIT
jgi:cytochrome c oxidase subunit 3